jgi:hypothetical protein
MPRRNKKARPMDTTASIMRTPDNDPAEAGQSGDLQGLSGVPVAESESVRELVEEGQFFEAAVTAGVEDAPDPDVSEVRTTEVAEDDVPPEYRDKLGDEPKE